MTALFSSMEPRLTNTLKSWYEGGFLIIPFYQLIFQRLAGSHFDSDGAEFMRIEDDGNSNSASPRIKAVRVGT